MTIAIRMRAIVPSAAGAGSPVRANDARRGVDLGSTPTPRMVPYERGRMRVAVKFKHQIDVAIVWLLIQWSWTSVVMAVPGPGRSLAAPPRHSQAPLTSAGLNRCAGDCNDDGSVTVDELVSGVSIALGHLPADSCRAIDLNADGVVTVDEVLSAINAVLDGCRTPPATPAPQIRITAPVHGSFTLDPSTTVSGQITNPVAGEVVTINGMPVAVGEDGTFSMSVSLDRSAIFNPILAEVAVPATGFTAGARVVVIAGDSIADGAFSPQSVGLRINDSGFQQLEPLFPMRLSIDLEALIAPGTRLITGYCAIDSVFGCLQRVDVVARAATVDSSTINLDSMSGFVAAAVILNGVRVAVEISGGPIDCRVDVVASTATISGDYDLMPLASDPQRVDVQQVGDVAVALTNFDYAFTSGICDFPVVGDLLRAVVGNIEPTVHDGLINYLQDPDGPGPQDAPIAAAMQSALEDVAIGAPIGQALGVDFESPFFAITEDTAGVTFGSNARITALNRAAGAPNLTASYHVDAQFPTFGASTPVQALPYDLGLCISTSALNQLLKAEVQSGLLAADITQVNVGGGTIPLTAAVLRLFVPEFGALDPELPVTIRVRPTLAPIVTGNPGPNGELAELRISQVLVEVVSAAAGGETSYVRIAVDAHAGLDLTFDDSSRGLVFALAPPRATDVTLTLLANPIGVNESRLRAAVPALLARLLPGLGGSLGSFPTPQLLGLQARGVEVSRSGPFICLFLDFQ